MSKLMDAIGGISDRHITEFAYVKPQKKAVPLWARIIPAAACAAIIAAAVVGVPRIIPHEAGIINNNNYANSPEVYFNDRYYNYDGSVGAFTEPPDGYERAGAVTSRGVENRGKNGYTNVCKIGDIIYADPNDTEYIFVYTNVEYTYFYLRFHEAKAVSAG